MGLRARGIERAAPGDGERVVEGLREVAKALPHLRRRLEAMLGREPAPFRLRDIGALGDAEQRIVRLEHALICEERLVGRDQGKAVAIGELEERAFDLVLDGQAMALQLDIEPPGEDAGKLEQ